MGILNRLIKEAPQHGTNSQEESLIRPWAGRENAVGVKHVEGFDLGVEELVGARRLPAVELVGHGELRVEAARQDDLEEGEVPDGPILNDVHRCLRFLSDFPFM